MRSKLPLIILILMGCQSTPQPVFKAVGASAETTPVISKEDAADDPAIWVHPTDPTKSLIIGTNKNISAGGLDIYQLNGSLHARVNDPGLNNVDLRQNIVWQGDTISIVVASRRTDSTLAVYSMDQSGTLLKKDRHQIKLEDPYGVCMGILPGSQDVVVAVTGKSGIVQRLKLILTDSVIKHQALPTLKLPTQVEGCVIDDWTGTLFVAEEDRGIFHYDWMSGTQFILLDSVGSGHLVDDVEGLALYTKSSLQGYLIASSQGSNTFAFYDRLPPFTYRGSIKIVDSASIDGATETDGIEATTAFLGDDYPEGVLVVQDGDNSPENQNFKIVDWRTVLNALK